MRILYLGDRTRLSLAPPGDRGFSQPQKRFVVDTVMESVFAMERGYSERLLHNLGLLAANPQFALQLAVAEFTQRLNRLD